MSTDSKMTDDTPSPFCQECGNLLVPRRDVLSEKMTLYCSRCKKNEEFRNPTMFQEKSSFDHSPKEFTRLMEENEPPPVPKVITQSYTQRKKKRCKHPRAIFQGFYQFSRGDEASRKYWFCPDCGQVFRYSGKVDYKKKRKIIDEKSKD